jgi:hypothetical protein
MLILYRQSLVCCRFNDYDGYICELNQLEQLIPMQLNLYFKCQFNSSSEAQRTVHVMRKML